MWIIHSNCSLLSFLLCLAFQLFDEIAQIGISIDFDKISFAYVVESQPIAWCFFAQQFQQLFQDVARKFLFTAVFQFGQHFVQL